jgi:ATP/maltotriose-dependent transcriptional regulator MalT
VNAALLSVRLGGAASASRFADESEDRAVRFSQTQILAQINGVRGHIAHHRGDLPEAERLLSQVVGELRRLGWIPVQTEYLGQLAAVGMAMSKLEQAETWARDLGDLADVLPEPEAKVESQTLLARIALLRHDTDAARAKLGEALEIATDTRNRLGVALVLAVIAQVARADGDTERATMLHAGAARIQLTAGYIYPSPRAREIERGRADIRASLGRTAYEAAWAEGESMNWNELIEYAEKALAPESPAPRE